MAQNIAGTFVATVGATAGGQASPILVIPSGVTSARVNVSGDIGASNRVFVQKSTDNGQNWTLTNNLSAAQTNLAVTVAHGEHWRLLAQSTSNANKTIVYSMSVES